MTKAKKRSLTRSTQTKKSRQEHGGSLAVGRRRKTRPLNIKQSHHITLKSIHAVGPRSLFRYKKMILSLMKKYSSRFQVKVDTEFSTTQIFKGVCSGDSGGPAFVEINGKFYVAGVINSGLGIGPVNCIISAYFARVDRFQNWIEQNLRLLKAY